MAKIPVHCYTNLDHYQTEIWPKYFCCRPQIGDYVQAESGKTLRICGIVHKELATTEIALNIELISI